MFYVKNNLPNLLEDLQIGSYTAISHGAVTKVVAKPMKEAGIFIYHNVSIQYRMAIELNVLCV